jgi:RecB family exonuclease
VAEQLGLAGMPARLFAVTPTRLTTWQDCPRRYRMTYLDRPTPQKGPPWAHNSVGAATHNALRAWWDEPLARRTPEQAQRLVGIHWRPEGFRDDAQSQRHLERTRDQVSTYVGQLDPVDEPVGLERTVGFTTELLTVSGRIDRIDVRTDVRTDEEDPASRRAVIVDYKTGRWVPDASDARSSLALALYALGARRVLRLPCSTVELHHVPSGQVAVAEHTEASLQRHLQRAEAIGTEAQQAEQALSARPPGDVANDLFPPVPGALCGWCDFRAHCPDGQAASAAKQSWDGLVD